MRRGALAQLVAELDSHSRRASTAAPRDRVIVVGSTTSPAELDEALLRAGRLGARSASPPGDGRPT